MLLCPHVASEFVLTATSRKSRPVPAADLERVILPARLRAAVETGSVPVLVSLGSPKPLFLGLCLSSLLHGVTAEDESALKIGTVIYERCQGACMIQSEEWALSR